MNRLGFIYIIKNLIIDSYYVGQTTQPLHVRIGQHISDALTGRLNLPIHNVIKKYGWRSFEVSSWNFPVDVLDTMEISIISKMRGQHYKLYNVTLGGGGVRRISDSDAEIILKLWSDGYYMAEIADFVCVSHTSVKYVLLQCGVSEEDLFARNGCRVDVNSVVEINIRTGDSVESASDKTSLIASSIRSACNGWSLSLAGSVWRYLEDLSEEEKSVGKFSGKLPTRIGSDSNGKTVAQIDFDTRKILKIFHSAAEAARNMGMTRQAIGLVCRDVADSCADYFWRYVSEFPLEDLQMMGYSGSLPE